MYGYPKREKKSGLKTKIPQWIFGLSIKGYPF